MTAASRATRRCSSTLVDLAAYNLVNPTTATVTIADNPIPVVTIAALDPNAAETGADTGTFRFTRVSDTGFDLAVTYSVTGTASNTTDYQTITTTITIPAGQTTADRIITPIADGAPESSETVILTVTDGAQYEPRNTVGRDGDDHRRAAGGDDSRHGRLGDGGGRARASSRLPVPGSTTNRLVVPFAQRHGDVDDRLHAESEHQVTIGAGQASATVTLTALSDGSADTGEVATLTLTPNAATPSARQARRTSPSPTRRRRLRSLPPMQPQPKVSTQEHSRSPAQGET